MADQWVPSQFFFDATYLAKVGVERPRDNLYIVLHHSAGAEATDIPWLTTKGQVSVHRYVSLSGNRYQLVKDENAAWGCAVDPQYQIQPPRLGARWSRNENWPALQIEMENKGSDPFTDPQYEAAADWAAAWVQQYGIPADRHNIVGHRELTRSPQHQDPNDFWDWTRFMALIKTRLDAAQYVDVYIQSDPTMSRTLFHDTLAANPRSPITDDADRYYDLCVQYRINPAVALAFFVKESTKGTAGVSTQTLSWGNMRQAHNPNRSTGTMNTPWGPFAIYRSWLDSLADWCEVLLSDVYAGEGRTTVRSVIPKYAPAFENDTAQYIQQAITRITQWRDAAGGVPTPAPAPPASSPPPAPTPIDYIDYPILGAPTITLEKFRGVLQNNNSPALPEAETLYQTAVSNGVNPAVPLAFFVRISGAGTRYADPAKFGNHNWGEIVGNRGGIGGVQAYPTWTQGLIDWIRVVVQVYGGEGRTTLSTVVPRYQPAGTTDPQGFARDLSNFISAWRAPSTQSGTPSPTEAGGTVGAAHRV